MTDPLLTARSITKIYRKKDPSLGVQAEVLKGLDLDIGPNDSVCIVGASGSGKSTLLYIMGLMDEPTSGKVFFQDRDMSRSSASEKAQIRNKSMGFVFQFHHLLPEFTAIENVMMPELIAGTSEKKAESLARELLTDVGLQHRIKHYPSELSGGESQRVAVARALIRKPALLLADEPTGNLDSANSMMIQDLLLMVREKYQTALVTVTHDLVFASRFKKVLRLADGKWDGAARA